jgi:hypothetical protein
MGRRVLLALAIVIAIVLAGYFVFRVLLGGGRSEPGSVASASAAASAGSPADEARERVVVRSAVGRLERRGANGKWIQLRPGDEISAKDQIRTADGATASIDLGELVTVDVAESTVLNVAELSSTLSRVRLDDGRIVSKVHGSKGYRFRVQVKGSDAIAETGRGKFAVVRRGGGAVTVAAQEGAVNVKAQQQDVRVEAGEQSVVNPGSAPSPPSKIPTSLLLKLGRPPSRLRKRETEIVGQTAPGAVVSINGVPMTVGSDGNFTRKVALREGANDIVVVVEDAIGRRKEAELPKITVDSRAPGVRGKVVW